MTRRSFLAQGAMAAAAGAGLWACSSSVGDSEHGVNIDPRAYLNSGKGRVDPAGVIQPTKAFHARKPNIIIVLCDDLGWGDLGCYVNTAIRTPHVDALAKNGRVDQQH